MKTIESAPPIRKYERYLPFGAGLSRGFAFWQVALASNKCLQSAGGLLQKLLRMFAEKKNILWGIFLTALAYFIFTSSACAANIDIGSGHGEFTLLNPFDDLARGQGETWQNKIAGYAKSTFKILAVIEFTWAAAIWVFEKDALSPFMVEMIKKIMTICFFVYLLQNPTYITTAIVSTFKMIGVNATGFCTTDTTTGVVTCDTDAMTPDGVVATGFAIIDLIWDARPTSIGGIFAKLGQIFVAILVTIVIVVAYVIAALQLLVMNIESYLLLAAGAIFLAFGGSRWTQEYVKKYLTYAINVGVRFLVLFLVLGLTTSLAQKFAGGFIFEYKELFQMLVCGILTTILAMLANEMGNALIQGGSAVSAGSAIDSAKSAVGGVASAVGMGQSIVKKATSAGQGIYHAGKLAGNSYKLSKMEGKGKGAAAKTALGLAAKEGGRSLLNLAKGKESSHSFATSRDKANNEKMSKGEGTSKNPGALDRANREVKARMALANKKGGSVEGKGSSDSSGTGTSGSGSSGGGAGGTGGSGGTD